MLDILSGTVLHTVKQRMQHTALLIPSREPCMLEPHYTATPENE